MMVRFWQLELRYYEDSEDSSRVIHNREFFAAPILEQAGVMDAAARISTHAARLFLEIEENRPDQLTEDILLTRPKRLKGKRREWELEDIEHLDDMIDEVKRLTGAIALPGVESVRDQIAVRLGVHIKYPVDE